MAWNGVEDYKLNPDDNKSINGINIGFTVEHSSGGFRDKDKIYPLSKFSF